MLGHSFLHGGPCLAGLSRAFVHVLLQGSQDTATLQLEDCPDVDIRETINLLSGQSPLNEDQSSKVLELCLSWDLPGPTEENRRWLYERLLSHAVLGRRVRQIKQLKRGLKDTCVWPRLTERKDVVFFPKESEDSCTPEMLLSHISCPRESDDEDDEEYSADIKERITGYLKQFIETGMMTWRIQHSGKPAPEHRSIVRSPHPQTSVKERAPNVTEVSLISALEVSVPVQIKTAVHSGKGAEMTRLK
ncbi:uncharacterized protein LOC127964942 isoform X4 [Carassius gibelio]|uniref:uncharacterized protein LOC127964942 isoform X4 n=1 Tax=Carassius gibelio TaxID=101364 RepID=UPI0022781347|nr:uncharacterized protein LOC127964942 isoform X4 [Carassius gibelio]